VKLREAWGWCSKFWALVLLIGMGFLPGCVWQTQTPEDEGTFCPECHSTEWTFQEMSESSSGGICYVELDWVFYSQRNPDWSGEPLGSCTTTIGQQGCALTSAAMLLRALGINVNPKMLNDWLKKNRGYVNGCDISWTKVAQYDNLNLKQDWIKGPTRGSLTSPKDLKNLLDQGKLIIASSKRFSPTPHWVLIRGYESSGENWSDFLYWDPFDTTVEQATRRLGDGNVGQGSKAWVFQISYSISLSSTNKNFGPVGGTGEFKVNAPPFYAWTAVTDAPWIQITSSPTGKGDGTITYTVVPNCGSRRSRTGTIKICIQTHTIIQQGDTVKPSVPSSLTAQSTFDGWDTVVDLAWQQASDNCRVDKYQIYRDGRVLAELSCTCLTFRDKSVAIGKSYCYQIYAVDAAGNQSLPSNRVCIKAWPWPQVGNEIRIVLSWGESPPDLDAHLTGPAPDGGRFHVYFAQKVFIQGETKYADLDRDDVDSYGPEVITIYKQIDGEYRFSVHDYTNRYVRPSNALSRSGAQVEVYRGTTRLYTFKVPSREGTLWTVFKISGNKITPINSLSYESYPSNIQSLAAEGWETDAPLMMNLPPKLRE